MHHEFKSNWKGWPPIDEIRGKRKGVRFTTAEKV